MADLPDLPGDDWVVVKGAGSGFAQEVTVRTHRLLGDEPVAYGGTDSGPSPYDLLLAALGTCTSITLAMYARRKNWPLECVTVRLRHGKVHARDCEESENKPTGLDRIESEIDLGGALSEEQRHRLLEIANHCPVHRTLGSEIMIETRLAEAEERGRHA
jgi:putative redox protein